MKHLEFELPPKLDSAMLTREVINQIVLALDMDPADEARILIASYKTTPGDPDGQISVGWSEPFSNTNSGLPAAERHQFVAVESILDGDGSEEAGIALLKCGVGIYIESEYSNSAGRSITTLYPFAGEHYDIVSKRFRSAYAETHLHLAMHGVDLSPEEFVAEIEKFALRTPRLLALLEERRILFCVKEIEQGLVEKEGTEGLRKSRMALA